MIEKKLANRSIEELLKLRSDVEAALARKTEVLYKQLSLLSESKADVSARGKSSKLPILSRQQKPTKVGRSRGKLAPKYRSPEGDTWSGRGLKPRWLSKALGEGKSQESFLI